MPKMLPLRFSIRTKLFLLVLVAFSAMIFSTFWQIGQKAQSVSVDAVERSLNESRVVLETKIESRYNAIEEVATSIARDGRILPLVYDGDSKTLQDQSLEFQKVLDFDILFFTNAAGTVMARSDRPAGIGQNMAGKTPFFDAALNGEDGKGYFQSQGRLMQIVVVPIFDNVAPDLVRGTVALAYEFTEELAAEIHALTASDIGFFVFTRGDDRQVNGVSATSVTDQSLGENVQAFFASDQSNWRQIYTSLEPNQRITRQFGGEQYHSVIQLLGNDPSSPLGFVMVMRSNRELMKPYTQIQQTVLAIGGFSLLAVFIFAWLFARGISRPIVQLEAVAHDIEEGRFSGTENVPRSRDEIGNLFRAVVKMGVALKEKAELETYLAQISNEMSPADTLAGEALLGDEPTMGMEDSTLMMKDESLDSAAPPILEGRLRSLGPGEVIDRRFELVKALGNGAIGVVFLAIDNDLEEKVAVKLMTRELFDQNDSINFKEEIRLARRVTHRNILRTYDFGSWKDFYYITMEYVSGFDLDQLIKSKGPLDPHIGIIMARQICSAMNAAHEQGIIHLDLKPANMMVNRQGILKIMDFGLAKKLAFQGDELKSSDLTQANTPKALMGTPKYMAPEQFLSSEVDERTDIYAIGIILYTLLCGRAPFDSPNLIQLAEMHLHKALPKLRDKNNRPLAPGLGRIIEKAAEKKPEDRYPSVKAMLTDLNNLSA